MTRTYLSICGDSAVGKTTLINKLLIDGDSLRSRFQIGTGEIEAYGPRFYGQRFAKVEQWREQIFLTTADVVLYQWQHRTHDFISQLYEQNPECNHRVVLIWRPWDEHWRDYQVKHRRRVQRDRHTLQTLKHNWRTKTRPRFEDLQRELPIEFEIVNGATPQYERLEEWPRA